MQGTCSGAPWLKGEEPTGSREGQAVRDPTRVHELYGKQSPSRGLWRGHPDHAGEKGHGGTHRGVACAEAVF